MDTRRRPTIYQSTPRRPCSWLQATAGDGPDACMHDKGTAVRDLLAGPPTVIRGGMGSKCSRTTGAISPAPVPRTASRNASRKRGTSLCVKVDDLSDNDRRCGGCGADPPAVPMADVMSTTSDLTWHSLPDAASVLGVSVRTVERRIAAGELECRKDGKGHRQVGILPGQLDQERHAIQAMTATARASSDAASVLAVTLERTREDLEWTRNQVDHWRTQATSWRRWAGAGFLAAGLAVSVTVGLVVMPDQGDGAVRQSSGIVSVVEGVSPPVDVQRRTSEVEVVDPYDDPVGRMMASAVDPDCDNE